MNNLFKHTISTIVLSIFVFGQIAQAQVLLAKPDFITSTIVKPNIIMGVDNSGSMSDGVSYSSSYVYKPRKDASGIDLTIPTTTNSTCRGGNNNLNCRTWAAFYSNRLDMAKTVIWNAFLNIDPNIRVGMAQFRGTNIVLDTAKFDTAQKLLFFTQLFNLSASGGTPSHAMLEGVGNYYATSNNPYLSDNTNFTGLVSCRPNYHLFATDGGWNGPRGTRGNVDGTDGELITGPGNKSYQYRANGASAVSCGTNPVPGCSDGLVRSDTLSNTLADTAMYWWKTDLRTDLTNNVRTSGVQTSAGVNPAFWQNVITYGVSIGVPAQRNALPNAGGIGWINPDPSNSRESGALLDLRIDDVNHAAYNTFGEFVNANDPAAFDKAINDMLNQIATQIGSRSTASVSSGVIGQAAGIAFEPRFESAQWSGTVSARALDANGNANSVPLWDAGRILSASLNPKINPNGTLAARGTTPAIPNVEAFHLARNIFTRDISNVVANSGFISFKPSAMNAAQLALLTDTTVAGATGANVVNYLRGERYNEQRYGTVTAPRPFRNRDQSYDSSSQVKEQGYLGAIVNSNALTIGEARKFKYQGLPTIGKDYNDFWRKLNERTGLDSAGNAIAGKTRKLRVIVGSSDGMIHQFDGATGQEIMAYVPGTAYAPNESTTANRLLALTKPNYDHNYIVDGQFKESQYYTAGAWKTMTIGGMGAGGKGWVALDTTVPAEASDSETSLQARVLWELNNTTVGSTNAADLGYSYGEASTYPIMSGTAALPTTTWVTVFPNGYKSTSGAAALFVRDVVSGAVTKVSVAAGTGNGLSTPQPMFSASGHLIALYAGDIKGNLWKIKPPTLTSSAWTVKQLYAGVATQPITSAPTLDYTPDGRKVQVQVGTGSLSFNGDRQSSTAQQFMGIVDDDARAAAILPADLAKITLVKSGTQINVSTRQTATTAGWVMPFVQTGERMVSQAVQRNNVLYFVSVTPAGVNANNDPCVDDAGLVESTIYAISPRTGDFPGAGQGLSGSNSQVGLATPGTTGSLQFLRISRPLTTGTAAAPIVTSDPNRTQGQCTILLNKVTGGSSLTPIACPSGARADYWRVIPGGRKGG